MSEPPETIAFQSASTDRALERIASRDLPIGTVIDVGASNGMWSAVAMKHFPRARYLLVEANPIHQSALSEFCRINRNSEYVLKAAGDSLGQTYFDDSDPFGGVASKEQTGTAKAVLPVTTLDHEIEARRLPGPYMIKLDTHGFEVPILNGARSALREANLVVIETYAFRIIENQSLLFWEMCKFMADLGFGVVDASEPLWRQHDRALWQLDLFFLPLNRKEFAYNRYA